MNQATVTRLARVHPLLADKVRNVIKEMAFKDTVVEVAQGRDTRDLIGGVN